MTASKAFESREGFVRPLLFSSAPEISRDSPRLMLRASLVKPFSLTKEARIFERTPSSSFGNFLKRYSPTIKSSTASPKNSSRSLL